VVNVLLQAARFVLVDKRVVSVRAGGDEPVELVFAEQLHRVIGQLVEEAGFAGESGAFAGAFLLVAEDGKINTEEGSELLEAMGRSSALRGQDTFFRLDIAMLIGVALVILGFFLPWAYLGNRMYQAGHHRGPIGWAILIAAVLSAIPIFVTPKDMLYKISMLQIFLILVGLALIIKELSVGADQAGTIFCLAGFLIALLSSGVKLKSLAA